MYSLQETNIFLIETNLFWWRKILFSVLYVYVLELPDIFLIDIIIKSQTKLYVFLNKLIKYFEIKIMFYNNCLMRVMLWDTGLFNIEKQFSKCFLTCLHVELLDKTWFIYIFISKNFYFCYFLLFIIKKEF